MPEKTDPDQNNIAKPRAEEVLGQVAALARHLQASGIEFLPNADPNAVAERSNQFASNVTTGPALAETPQVDAAKTASVAQPETPRVSVTAAEGASGSPNSLLDESSSDYPLASLPIADRGERLADLAKQVASCTRCDQLAQCRTNTVFGEGNASPRVAFFGEGPGADEDRSGRPFVGRAGQLLTKMIQACTFEREDVYILNTVKCRPPGNRNPEPDELNNCREYFEKQFAILQPEYIVCLGAISAQTLLETRLSVGRMRGRWHRYFASKVLVTYHPAYLLRNPAAKKAAWEDLQMMLGDMGIEASR